MYMFTTITITCYLHVELWCAHFRCAWHTPGALGVPASRAAGSHSALAHLITFLKKPVFWCGGAAHTAVLRGDHVVPRLELGPPTCKHVLSPVSSLQFMVAYL